MHGRYRLGNLYGRCFRDLSFQLTSHLRGVIRKDRRLVAGAGDGNIPEPRIEQIGMHSGIGVDENPLGGEPLRAVAGHSVSVVEVPMNKRVELDLTSIVEARRDMSVWPDRIDHCKITVGDPQGLVWRRELNLVSNENSCTTSR
jgi:hypothetical protein